MNRRMWMAVALEILPLVSALAVPVVWTLPFVYWDSLPEAVYAGCLMATLVLMFASLVGGLGWSSAGLARPAQVIGVGRFALGIALAVTALRAFGTSFGCEGECDDWSGDAVMPMFIAYMALPVVSAGALGIVMWQRGGRPTRAR